MCASWSTVDRISMSISQPVHTLVVARPGLMRNALIAYLRAMPGVEVDVIADLPSAGALGVPRNHLDTLIIDAAAPADLMGLLRQLNAERPDLHCIVLADSLAQEKAALAAGAGAALLKGFLDERLGQAVLQPATLPQVKLNPPTGLNS